MMSFYYRKNELQLLKQAWSCEDPQIVMLHGRSGVGKTHLLRHFLGKEKRHCYFCASAASVKENLRKLAHTLNHSFQKYEIASDDLPTISGVMQATTQASDGERVALILDNFQYMLCQDASLVDQLAQWWESFGAASNIFLVLCGSDQQILQELISEHSPLSEHIRLHLDLKPMTVFETSSFYSAPKYLLRDKLVVYGALGGIPKYNAIFNPEKDVMENIQETILSPKGQLHNKPEFLLLSNGVRDISIYNEVLGAIAGGCTRPSAIAAMVGITSSKLNFYLESLMEIGCISKVQPFDETSQRKTVYNIEDHFIRFWYSFVYPFWSELEFGDYKWVCDNRIKPQLDEYMHRVFVDVGHQYLKRLEAKDVIHQSVTRLGRYWRWNEDEQIDMLAELEDGGYLIGECVWTSLPTGVDVYYKLKEKALRLLGAKYTENADYLIICSAARDDELKQLARTNGLYVVSVDS